MALVVKERLFSVPIQIIRGNVEVFNTYLLVNKGGITFLESKEAANKRKEGNRELSQSVDNISAYLEPIDAEEPF